jgi:two-component system, chemotaxis family, sensor kinase Cph1
MTISWLAVSLILAAVVLLLLAIFILKSKGYTARISVLQEKEKQREDYVAMVVHDIRSPLAVIRGASEILLKQKKSLSSENIGHLLDQIHETSEELLKMIGNVLDVHKIDSGNFEVDKKGGDLNGVLKNEADYYLPLATEKTIKIKTSFDKEVPRLEFDLERIKRVLNNLMSNALKITPKGGVVTVTSALNGKQVLVSVSDTGKGIRDSMKEKLFNKYVQGAEQKEKDVGTGLGLYIAKAIVERHGGEIWIENNKPTGARFVFSLPLK